MSTSIRPGTGPTPSRGPGPGSGRDSGRDSARDSGRDSARNVGRHAAANSGRRALGVGDPDSGGRSGRARSGRGGPGTGSVGRWAVAALVAVAVLCSAWPLHLLFDGTAWLSRLVVVVAVVALTGMLARPRLSPLGVLVAQLVAYLVTLLALFGGDTLALGFVPTVATLGAWHDFLQQAGATLREYAAPAPETPGVTFLLTAAVGAVGLTADALAATLRRPALAGLALLAPFLAAVANSDGGLPPGYFVAASACWLTLLALHDRELVGAWGDREPDAGWGAESGAESGAGSGARRSRSGPAVGRVTGASRAAGRRSSATALLGVCAIVVSLGAAAVLPHLPVRYLADGLGTGGIGGRGQVGFSPSTQMVQDLRSTQGRPILHYRTDDPTPPPLRVAVSSVYRNGEWVPDDDAEVPSASPRLRYPLGWQQEVSPAQQRRIEVTDNRLAAPYLASPPDVIEGRVYDAQWAQGRTTGVLSVDSVPGRYSLTYLDITPEPRVLRADELQVYPRSAQETLDGSEITPLVWDLARQVTADADGAYDQAMAIQEWLRSSGGFTYSLELAPPPPGLTEEEANATAVDRFLETKRGYCVQFTTAMVLMARSLGIPARTATGFLPGTEVDGVREVVPSDAHAWPELYFAGVGWLRFEPTPGTRSGTPPSYSVAQPTQGAGTASPTASAPAPSASPTAAASTPAAQRPERDADIQTPGEQPTQDRSWWWALLVPPALLLAAAIVPVAAWRSRRARLAGDRGRGGIMGRRGQRSHGGADADRVEAHWAGLLDRVGDLGVIVNAADTLAQQQESLRVAAGLRAESGGAGSGAARAGAADGAGAGVDGATVADGADGADEALIRLVATVQTARYAPPGSLSREAVRRVPADARLVRRAVVRASDRRRRLRAALWPSAGLEAVRRLFTRGRTPRPREPERESDPAEFTGR